MTNFDIFLASPKFAPFAEVAVSAEKILNIDPAACVLNCRRAMEFAVKWMYSVDGELVLPWDDKLVSLMSTDEFRGVVDGDLLRRMDFIRKRCVWRTCTYSSTLWPTATGISMKSGRLIPIS